MSGAPSVEQNGDVRRRERNDPVPRGMLDPVSRGGLVGGVLLGGLVLLLAASARAQPEATEARQAAARVLVVRDAEVLSTGSGAVIDPAGYVLTCFHVVGYIAGPFVGTLRDPRARLIVELPSTSSPGASGYEAELVRGRRRRRTSRTRERT